MTRKLLALLIGVFFVFMFLPYASIALTGGPDAGGYGYYDSYEKDAAPFVWEGIENDDKSVGIPEFKPTTKEGGEGAILSHPVDIGFTFTFYGIDYTKIYVSKYGYLTFNDGPPIAYCKIEPIPTKGRANADNFIAEMWAYLHPGT